MCATVNVYEKTLVNGETMRTETSSYRDETGIYKFLVWNLDDDAREPELFELRTTEETQREITFWHKELKGLGYTYKGTEVIED